jgi:hypothetical protein
MCCCLVLLSLFRQAWVVWRETNFSALAVLLIHIIFLMIEACIYLVDFNIENHLSVLFAIWNCLCIFTHLNSCMQR